MWRNLKYSPQVFVVLCFIFLWVGVSYAGPGDAPSPYAKWSNGPSADPGYFPIGVWLQDPKYAARYKAAGINVYVGLWKGPTEQQLSALASTGMRTICRQNRVGLAHLYDPTIVAWMQPDEPDNAQRMLSGN